MCICFRLASLAEDVGDDGAIEVAAAEDEGQRFHDSSKPAC